MRWYMQKEHFGFTLIELMIVVVILGLLATMVMPKILDRPERARQVKAVAEIKSIEFALTAFLSDTGRLPTTAEGLQALVINPGVENYSSKGYLNDVPLDPWGKLYIYIQPSLHGNHDFDIESYGKDGENGGTEYSSDIESWNLK